MISSNFSTEPVFYLLNYSKQFSQNFEYLIVQGFFTEKIKTVIFPNARLEFDFFRKWWTFSNPNTLYYHKSAVFFHRSASKAAEKVKMSGADSLPTYTVGYVCTVRAVRHVCGTTVLFISISFSANNCLYHNRSIQALYAVNVYVQCTSISPMYSFLFMYLCACLFARAGFSYSLVHLYVHMNV